MEFGSHWTCAVHAFACSVGIDDAAERTSREVLNGISPLRRCDFALLQGSDKLEAESSKKIGCSLTHFIRTPIPSEGRRNTCSVAVACGTYVVIQRDELRLIRVSRGGISDLAKSGMNFQLGQNFGFGKPISGCSSLLRALLALKARDVKTQTV